MCQRSGKLVPVLSTHADCRRGTRSVYLRILDSLRNHAIKLQFMEFAYGTSVSLMQARLIDEYVKRGAPRIEELVPVLGVHKSSVSRHLKTLVNGGFLRRERSVADLRCRIFSATPKGQRLLGQLRSRSIEHYERDAAKLSPEEMRELVDLCSALSGGGEAIPMVRVPGESDLMIALRRLAYAHGYIAGNYLGSGLSVLQFVVLSEVYHGEMDVVSLSRLLKTPHSTLSERINAMVERGWLNSTQSRHDRRLRALSLTPAGVAAVKRIERKAERLFKSALRGLTPVQLQRFEDLLTRYVAAHEWRPLPPRLVDLDAERVSQRELTRLRSALLAQIACNGVRYPLSGFLFSPDSATYRITRRGVECCVCEVRRDSRQGGYILVNYLVRCENIASKSGNGNSKRLLATFLSQLLGGPVRIEAKWQSVLGSTLNSNGMGAIVSDTNYGNDQTDTNQCEQDSNQ